MLACDSAPGCSAFAYSPQDRACFLKGCPSNFSVQCPVRSLHMTRLQENWLASINLVVSLQNIYILQSLNTRRVCYL